MHRRVCGHYTVGGVAPGVGVAWPRGWCAARGETLASVDRDQWAGEVESGKRLHSAGRLGEAEGFYLAVLGRDPRNAEALHYLGLLAHQTGERERARDLLSRSLAIRPTSAVFHYNVGIVCRESGNAEGAIYFLRQAIDLAPGYGSAYGALASALRGKGRTRDAVCAARWALDLGHETVEVMADLVWGLLESDENDESLEMLRKCFNLEGGTPETWHAIGVCAARKGLHREALEAYRRAVLLRPDFADATAAIDASLASLNYRRV